MNLLLQLFGDAVEAKSTGSLDEDDLVMKMPEVIAGQEVVGGGEEHRILNRHPGSLRFDARTNGNEF